MAKKIKIGYHGTTKENKIKILEKGNFEVRTNNSGRTPNDLGNGIYFFCDDQELDLIPGHDMAIRYTKKYKKVALLKQNSSVDVIKATIKYNEENLLDLDDEQNLQDFLKAKRKLEYQVAQEAKRSKDDGAKDRDNRDGFFVEIFLKVLRQSGFDVKVVSKRTFTPVAQKTSNFPNALELCVKDVELITINSKRE